MAGGINVGIRGRIPKEILVKNAGINYKRMNEEVNEEIPVGVSEGISGEISERTSEGIANTGKSP